MTTNSDSEGSTTVMTKPVEHGLQLFFKKFKQKCWKGHHNYFCKSWCNFKALAQMLVCTHPRASSLTDHRAGQSVKTSDYYYIDPWITVINKFIICFLSPVNHIPNLAHTWAGLVLVTILMDGESREGDTRLSRAAGEMSRHVTRHRMLNTWPRTFPGVASVQCTLFIHDASYSYYHHGDVTTVWTLDT